MKYRLKFLTQHSDIVQHPDKFLLLFLINFHIKKLCLNSTSLNGTNVKLKLETRYK